MNPTVSVIIPTYNRRQMVLEAVKSVLAQSGTSFELIVVDDGSTDGTYETLREFLDCCGLLSVKDGRRHVSAWLTEVRLERITHQGVAAARNHGAAIAKGTYLAFLDSDDLWLPSKLKLHTDFMDSQPDLCIAQTEEIWLRNGRRMNPGRRHQKRSGDIFADSLRTCLISPSAVAIKASVFWQVGGFDVRMKACEDYDLWLRLVARNRVGLLETPLVVRRAGHPDQLSAITPALDRFRVLSLLKLLSNDELSPERRDMVLDVFVEKCTIIGNGLLKRGRLSQAAIYQKAAKLADTRWRQGDMLELTEYSEALSACGLSETLFSPSPAPSAHPQANTLARSSSESI